MRGFEEAFRAGTLGQQAAYAQGEPQAIMARFLHRRRPEERRSRASGERRPSRAGPGPGRGGRAGRRADTGRAGSDRIGRSRAESDGAGSSRGEQDRGEPERWARPLSRTPAGAGGCRSPRSPCSGSAPSSRSRSEWSSGSGSGARSRAPEASSRSAPTRYSTPWNVGSRPACNRLRSRQAGSPRSSPPASSISRTRPGSTRSCSAPSRPPLRWRGSATSGQRRRAGVVPGSPGRGGPGPIADEGFREWLRAGRWTRTSAWRNPLWVEPLKTTTVLHDSPVRQGDRFLGMLGQIPVADLSEHLVGDLPSPAIPFVLHRGRQVLAHPGSSIGPRPTREGRNRSRWSMR